MKALLVTSSGGSESLAYGEHPDPAIAHPSDVLVRVRAAAMNRLDVFQREGSHGSAPATFPYITGREFAGDVAAVGHMVTRFKVGDRVFGASANTHAQLIRIRSDGSLRNDALELIPPALSYEQAAAMPISFCMAWHMLHCKGRLRTGEDVLVMGASGGTGTSGIQLAKAAGARVITTAGTEEKLDKARALGADDVINYRQTPAFSEQVLKLTGGKGADLVFEHVGTPVWDECFRSLRQGGRLVICGVTAGHRASLHLGQLWMRDLTIMGAINTPSEDLAIIARLAARGSIHPVVDTVIPVEEAYEAHRRMEAWDFFGKIVLRFS